MTTEYRYRADQTVLEEFALAEDAERSRLLNAFEDLARHPEQRFEFTERGSDGRTFRAKWAGNWLVRYWVDDAVKVVVIVGVQWT